MIPAPLYEGLSTIADPSERAILLTELAEAEDAAGRPHAARLARLVADSERLIADPYTDPSDDAAWADEAWQRLATIDDRAQRANHLMILCQIWAAPSFGEEAGILLDLAAAERALAPPPTEPLAPAESAAPQDRKPLAEARRAGGAAEQTFPPRGRRRWWRAVVAWAMVAVIAALVTAVAVVPVLIIKLFAATVLMLMVVAIVVALWLRGAL